MNWIENITKIGALIITIVGAVYYFGGNQANIQNSISNNSKNIVEIKKGNERIISLLEKSQETQINLRLKVAKNTTKIKFYLEKHK